MNRLIATWSALLVFCGALHAQGAAPAQDQREEMRKKMEEISNLMRDSERLLIEAANLDQVLALQNKVAEDLKKLLKEPPPQPAAAAAEQRRQQQQELEQRQQDLTRRIEQLLEDQSPAGQRLVEKLEEVLKKWPRGGGRGGGQLDPNQRPRAGDKQNDRKPTPQQRRREEEEKLKRLNDSRKKNDARDQSIKQRIVDAWLARLPPEEQERVRKGDFSNVPQRYRRLIERYTIAAATREVEEDTADER